VGKVRASGEKELISCNLIARRDLVRELGGFDESMYPNEENALMDGLQARGKLLYDPEFVVYRHPRSNLKSFFKMLLFYGKGRAEQLRLHPTLNSLPNFIPPGFVLYLLALPFLAFWSKWSLLPLGLYCAAVLVQVACVALRGNMSLCLRVLPLVAMTNVLYGLGFWHGLFTRVAPPRPAPPNDIRLESVAV
jgi:hypothetical protein